MCGIVGFAGNTVPSPELFLRMRDCMRHRGPDDEGAWRSSDGRVALGHRRLSIIDLSPNGRQPMSDSSGRLQIVFNGEIYNYMELRAELQGRGRVFRTASDTEVILEAYLEWSDAALSRLNGMFALAIFDQAEERVLVARDRAGEKPLFYRMHAGTLAFASELKSLLSDPSCPRELDAEALEFYLAFGYVPGERCLLSGFRKLPQGHALSFSLDSGDLRTWPYWTLPRPEGRPPDEGALLEELQALAEDSVRLRLIADVPVGIMLSGGVDSSVITALAARCSSKRLKTFTISFPGHSGYDESAYARTVASHFGTEHIELAAEPATVDLVPELVRQFDEPIADSSMIPTYLLSRLIRREATVALGGDGGDEVFGGYLHHSWVQQQVRMGGWVPAPARRAARAAASTLLPIGTKGRNYLLGLTADPPYNIVQFNVLFDAYARERLLGAVGSRASIQPEAWKASLCADRQSVLQQTTALDFRTYLVDDILVKVDRASMLTSLEVRAPFLDPRIIEFAFGKVPDHLRATPTERKILLRRLAARLLPPSLDLRRKQGFSLPLRAWFKGDWGRYMQDILTSTDTIFDRRVVMQLFAGQRAGFTNMHRLFALAVLELWRREYRVTFVGKVPESAAELLPLN
jgi:asparagine synthase (glutamine-hydrolysing)